MATSGVGSAALCSCAILRIPPGVLVKGTCRAALGLDPSTSLRAGSRKRASPYEKLVSCVSGLLCCGLRCVLGCAFSGTKVFRQVSQQGIAIRVGDNGAQTFHFVEFVRPFLSSHVLLGDAAGVMAGSASGLHFGLHRSGRKRFAWGTGRLRARRNNGCEQKDCRKNSFEQAGSLSQFSVLSSQFSVLSSQNWMCFVFCGCYYFAVVCAGDWVPL